MNRWNGKIAVVTGSSSGIGASIVVDLVKAGMVVVGLARRVERTKQLKENLPEPLRTNLHAIKCDISKEADIIATFAEIEKRFGGVDVLVNNAGVFRDADLCNADSIKIREVIDTNVLGLVFCTREAVQSMKKRGDCGHVIHINSVAGHKVPMLPGGEPKLNIYPASKYAVTALTETLRQELLNAGSKIRVTSISPGGVRTEIIPEAMLKMIEEHKSPILEPEDISEAVLYVLGTPPRVQVHELTIRPLGEAF